MLKFGICTLGEVDRSRAALLRGGRRFRRFCSIELYEALARRGGEQDEALQAAVLDLFPIANGAYKRTGRLRFGSFDLEVTKIVAERFPVPSPLNVHDMAVSDGRTSCDLYRLLSEAAGARLRFVASDVCIRVTALSWPGERLTAVVDEDGVLLQMIWPPFVLPIAQTESWFFPVNRLLRRALLGRARRLMAGLPGDRAIQRRDILLLCNEARSLSGSRSNFLVERHDMFEAAPRRYQVVRSMNVLNPSYFGEARLRRALACVHASLDPGGLFVVGSNGDVGSTVDGGVYERRGDRLCELKRWGSGPRVADLLESPLGMMGDEPCPVVTRG